MYIFNSGILYFECSDIVIQNYNEVNRIIVGVFLIDFMIVEPVDGYM